MSLTLKLAGTALRPTELDYGGKMKSCYPMKQPPGQH